MYIWIVCAGCCVKFDLNRWHQHLTLLKRPVVNANNYSAGIIHSEILISTFTVHWPCHAVNQYLPESSFVLQSRAAWSSRCGFCEFANAKLHVSLSFDCQFDSYDLKYWLGAHMICHSDIHIFSDHVHLIFTYFRIMSTSYPHISESCPHQSFRSDTDHIYISLWSYLDQIRLGDQIIQEIFNCGIWRSKLIATMVFLRGNSLCCSSLFLTSNLPASCSHNG